MKDVKEILPWEVTDISIRPYDGMWSMNPSIHFDGSLWRCVLRCTDYAMPNGITIRSDKARPAGNQTQNAMVIFDPSSWKAAKIYKMRELDGFPRAPCANVGYEDMRIFRTDRGGLQGIAASLHLGRERRPTSGGSQTNQPPEQVLLSFDQEYNIVAACPIRGDGWSGTPQKNWVPFDHCAEPRFLYSIDRGTMFNERGAISGNDALARPSGSQPFSDSPLVSSPPEVSDQHARSKPTVPDRRLKPTVPDRRTMLRGAEVQMVRGRVAVDTMASRPSSRQRLPAANRVGTRGMMDTGRAMPPKYEGLRGGTQLLRIGDDTWLGIGHEMQFVRTRKKYYWHVFYTVNSSGKLIAASVPMKLAPNGIEFAAGMAIDGDRVVVSFGVDDMECKLGTTRLSAVMEIMKPVER